MSKSIYNAFQTDENLELRGIVLDFGSAGKVRISRAGGANKKFEKTLMKLTKPYRHAINSGTLDPKIADGLLHRAYAETVVLGWEGIVGPDDKEIPYSVENAMKVFGDLPDFFLEIKRNADNAALFRAEQNEADAKN